jgi:hypothetical protein
MIVPGAAVYGDLDERARLPEAEKLSSPPLASNTRFSEVPMSILNGAGLTRSKRTRVPLAVTVNCSGSVSAIHLDSVVSVAAFIEIRVVARIPDHAIIAGFAEYLVVSVTPGEDVIVGATEEKVDSAVGPEGVIPCLPEEQSFAGTAVSVVGRRRQKCLPPEVRRLLRSAQDRRFLPGRISASLKYLQRSGFHR